MLLQMSWTATTSLTGLVCLSVVHSRQCPVWRSQSTIVMGQPWTCFVVLNCAMPMSFCDLVDQWSIYVCFFCICVLGITKWIVTQMALHACGISFFPLEYITLRTFTKLEHNPQMGTKKENPNPQIRLTLQTNSWSGHGPSPVWSSGRSNAGLGPRV